MIILSHPTANQNVRQAALAFAEAGLLEEFWTGVSWNEDGFLTDASRFLNACKKNFDAARFRPR